MNDLFPFLSQRIFNAPLMLHPAKAEIALASLADRLGIARIVRADGAPMSAFDDDDDFGFNRASRQPIAGYDLVAGVAVIQVEGLLVQKTGTLRPYSGMTGYDGIRTNLLTALSDPDVEAIALDLNSPGGEISGCFDLVDTIFAARGVKPLWAICADCAFSAAYALASACDRITVPRMGGTGSIGVITMLVDYSRAITAAGLTVHFVYSGARKAMGTRAEATGVKPELLDRIQADVDMAADLFFTTVARNRSSITAEAVRAQEGDYFTGALGVKAGLADAVMAPDEAFRELIAELDAA